MRAWSPVMDLNKEMIEFYTRHQDLSYLCFLIPARTFPFKTQTSISILDRNFGQNFDFEYGAATSWVSISRTRMIHWLERIFSDFSSSNITTQNFDHGEMFPYCPVSYTWMESKKNDNLVISELCVLQCPDPREKFSIRHPVLANWPPTFGIKNFQRCTPPIFGSQHFHSDRGPTSCTSIPIELQWNTPETWGLYLEFEGFNFIYLASQIWQYIFCIF